MRFFVYEKKSELNNFNVWRKNR